MGPGPLKPLRPLAGRPMVAHVVERLRPQVMDLVVVANDPSPAFRKLKVPVIADPPDIQDAAQREGRRLGPLAGVLAGMEWSLREHPHAGWILTAPADVPFLPLDLTVRLCGHMHVPEPDVLVIRHGGHREPSLGVWSVKLADDLRRAILDEGMRRVGQFAERAQLASELADRGLAAEAKRERDFVLQAVGEHDWYVGNLLSQMAHEALSRREFARAADLYERIAAGCLRQGTQFVEPAAYLNVPRLTRLCRARAALWEG